MILYLHGSISCPYSTLLIPFHHAYPLNIPVKRAFQISCSSISKCNTCLIRYHTNNTSEPNYCPINPPFNTNTHRQPLHTPFSRTNPTKRPPRLHRPHIRPALRPHPLGFRSRNPLRRHNHLPRQYRHHRLRPVLATRNSNHPPL